MASLSTVEIFVYAALAVPVMYLLVKHGRHGLLGWLYLFAFCSLRVIGGVLDRKGSSAAGIVANIGLSPLILAASGILHEAYVPVTIFSVLQSPSRLRYSIVGTIEPPVGIRRLSGRLCWRFICSF